uniref:Uncharacterized protein n=1 Tax=Chromera velia CCMP2878 TaxID=1169474 RepID=A0A0G4HZA2_9ALVE|eukprot:Cvel_9643.t1-p1 / transcript=Cvel_9643.t1 / gene=Cvel_9643 / organism=Chromera_velia_CCMP2878 / gene_product=hypothetical protein / transcript_product=hypothetical protein / location=Cvel_scaffold561:314-15154(+) / protein_length=110 / sequence_SO=supercontig / SO=protein_coding / is_pseudo=false
MVEMVETVETTETVETAEMAEMAGGCQGELGTKGGGGGFKKKFFSGGARWLRNVLRMGFGAFHCHDAAEQHLRLHVTTVCLGQWFVFIGSWVSSRRCLFFVLVLPQLLQR